MKSVPNVLNGYSTTIFGGKGYENLYGLRFHDTYGTTVTRWKLNWKERLKILISGNMYISVLTFNQPFQPIKPEASFPEFLK